MVTWHKFYYSLKCGKVSKCFPRSSTFPNQLILTMKNIEAGAFLNACYSIERNVRIQNVPGKGFYGGFSNGSIYVNWGIHIEDFMKPKENQVLADGWNFNKHLQEVCKWLLEKALKDNPEFTQVVESESTTNLESVLMKAHAEGWKFIIEMVWDSGFDIYLLNSNLSAPNINRSIGCFPAQQIGEWMEEQMHGELVYKV